MVDQQVRPEKEKSLIEVLSEEGKKFVKDFPVGSEVEYLGDSTSWGITQPGRVYNNPMDTNVIIKYELYEGQKYHGLGVWSVRSVQFRAKPPEKPNALSTNE